MSHLECRFRRPRGKSTALLLLRSRSLKSQIQNLVNHSITPPLSVSYPLMSPFSPFAHVTDSHQSLNAQPSGVRSGSAPALLRVCSGSAPGLLRHFLRKSLISSICSAAPAFFRVSG